MGPADSRTASTHHPDRNAVALDLPEPADRRHLTRDLDRRLESLPDWHPSSPRYADQVRPLTDAEHADHIAKIRSALDAAKTGGLSTDRLFTTDAKHRVWSDERAAQQDEVIADLYWRSQVVPCEGKAILAGGLPGSGKTTVLTRHAEVELSKYLMINPDSIKEEMARRGLIPDVDGLSPMEASDLAHEEASHIAKQLAVRAHGDGRNLIWDITMSSTDSTQRRIADLRAASYTHIEGVFVDIPPELSARRADARHREGHDAFRAGHGFGGRYIPTEAILARTDMDLVSDSRRTFEKLKHRFDGWSQYDNSIDGSPPFLAETNTTRHHDSREGN